MDNSVEIQKKRRKGSKIRSSFQPGVDQEYKESHPTAPTRFIPDPNVKINKRRVKGKLEAEPYWVFAFFSSSSSLPDSTGPSGWWPVFWPSSTATLSPRKRADALFTPFAGTVETLPVWRRVLL